MLLLAHKIKAKEERKGKESQVKDQGRVNPWMRSKHMQESCARKHAIQAVRRMPDHHPIQPSIVPELAIEQRESKRVAKIVRASIHYMERSSRNQSKSNLAISSRLSRNKAK